MYQLTLIPVGWLLANEVAAFKRHPSFLNTQWKLFYIKKQVGILTFSWKTLVTVHLLA